MDIQTRHASNRCNCVPLAYLSYYGNVQTELKLLLQSKLLGFSQKQRAYVLNLHIVATTSI